MRHLSKAISVRIRKIDAQPFLAIKGGKKVYPIANYGTVFTRFHHPGHEDTEPVGEEKFIQLWQTKVSMASLSPVFASLDGQEQGLVNSKVAACATKDFVHGVCVNEFEAVAKSASLASRRKNHHRSGRKREVQLQNLTQGRFKGQHRCDS
jgi:hypothetical protein